MAAPPAGTALLVEPYDDAREMYVELFRHFGIRTKAVGTAADALALAPHVDVVVTDIRLGGHVDGIELITRLRSDERTREMPIIVLSADVMASDRERAKQAGCDLFLAKPCPHEELVGAVARLLLKRVRGKSLKAGAGSARSASPRQRRA